MPTRTSRPGSVLGRRGRHARLLARPQRGPAPDPEVGPRLRRGRRCARPPTSGTSGRRRRGRSSRRRPRSACTPSTSSPGFFDPTGLMLPIVNEELAWGDAGIALAIFGSTLGVAGIAANGTPEQMIEWVPQCFGTPDDIQLGRVLRVGARRRLRRQLAATTRAVYDEAKDEWVINGTKTWITNGGIADIHVVVASVDPELGSRARPASSCPPARPGSRQGQKFKKMGIRASHTAEVVLDDVPRPRALPARRQGEARRAAGPGPRGQAVELAGGHGHVRGHPPGGRRPGARHRPGRLRVRPRLRQGAQGVRSGASSRTRASPSSSPT